MKDKANRQCENCYEDYREEDSDAEQPKIFCSSDCEHDREDKAHQFDHDFEFIMDHDHSMDY